ncbi:hypothetical protein TB1_036260 [Malus domestica]
MATRFPDDFKCPTSLEIMSDPVILSSGHTFDRASIQRWLDAGHTRLQKGMAKFYSLVEKCLSLVDLQPQKIYEHYVGIWYKKDVEKRVVWVENRDNPVNDTSGILSTGANGDLFLYAENQSDIPLWSAISNVSIASLPSNSTHEPNYKAQLLDTGNLEVKFQDSCEDHRLLRSR